MRREYSCGAVVYTKLGEEYRYVIIRSRGGDYGFAKGHMEGNETEEETALREVKEETGLSVRLTEGFRMVDEYRLPGKSNVVKKVVYFLASYENQKITPQLSELSSAQLMSYNTAMSKLTFPKSREILLEAATFLDDGERLKK
ncbi:MAG: NUDIX domain-containing protein [Clostridia bacterium]|nr:NUDIX domain-containing protein [Clostridia bacterium]